MILERIISFNIYYFEMYIFVHVQTFKFISQQLAIIIIQFERQSNEPQR